MTTSWRYFFLWDPAICYGLYLQKNILSQPALQVAVSFISSSIKHQWLWCWRWTLRKVSLRESMHNCHIDIASWSTCTYHLEDVNEIPLYAYTEIQFLQRTERDRQKESVTHGPGADISLFVETVLNSECLAEMFAMPFRSRNPFPIVRPLFLFKAAYMRRCLCRKPNNCFEHCCMAGEYTVFNISLVG